MLWSSRGRGRRVTGLRLPTLDLLLSFEAVARRGSITAAAAERCITEAAMSCQGQSPEAALGVPVDARRHRTLMDGLPKKRQPVVAFGEATATARADSLLPSPAAAGRRGAQSLVAWSRTRAAKAEAGPTRPAQGGAQARQQVRPMQPARQSADG